MVQIGETISKPLEVTVGVPQGGCLSPLLFILFINDMFGSLDIEAVCFADDTSLIASDKDPHILKHKLNTNLSHLYNWLNANKLKLNISKTSYLTFTNKKIDKNLDIKIGNKILTRLTETKLLGLLLNG